MQSLLLCQCMITHSEVRNNGKIGLKILLIGEICKKLMLITDLHIGHHFKKKEKKVATWSYHQMPLVIQHFLHNRLLMHPWQFHFMSKPLPLLALGTQLEVKKDGRPGRKISKIMVYNKRWLQIQESHIFQHYNFQRL